MELFFLIASLFAFIVNSGTTPLDAQVPKPAACDFFTYDNAAKIIGAPVRGEDGGMTEDETGRAWRCTFVAADNNRDSPKLHFMLMRNNTNEAARSAFDAIRVSNKKNAGFEEWPGVGDEAVVHTDGNAFQFVMIRKGNNTIRLKVNPTNGVRFAIVKEVAASLLEK